VRDIANFSMAPRVFTQVRHLTHPPRCAKTRLVPRTAAASKYDSLSKLAR
jgi:hypothetical protein